jgi:hypothetical protein
MIAVAVVDDCVAIAAAAAAVQGCGLQELQLMFADVCDTDIAALTALTSLTHVDLHCSR